MDADKIFVWPQPDAEVVRGRVIKRKDGTFVYEGRFQIDGKVKRFDELTDADKTKLSEDLERERRQLAQLAEAAPRDVRVCSPAVV